LDCLPKVWTIIVRLTSPLLLAARCCYFGRNLGSLNVNSLKGEGYITFKPRLFNKGYRINVVVMVSGFSGNVKAEGLIKGARSIRNVRYPSFSKGVPWKRTLIFSFIAFEISLALAVISLATSYGLKFFTQEPGYPSSGFQDIGTFLLFIVFLTGFSAFEIYWGMKVTDRTKPFIKQIFSFVQESLEKEAQNQTPQQAKKTTTPPRTRKRSQHQI
jgi:hypothetical protein